MGVRVSLNLEESDDLRKYIREQVGGTVRSIIREEMGNIVAAELAKQRMLQPGSPLLSELVHKEVANSVKSITANAQMEARRQMHDLIKKEISEQVRPNFQLIKTGIRDELIRLVKEMP